MNQTTENASQNPQRPTGIRAGRRVLDAEQFKRCAPILDADAEQAAWEDYIRAPCRPCRDVIVAQETSDRIINAEFQVKA